MDNLPALPSVALSKRGMRADSRIAGQQANYGFSYEPLVKKDLGAVDASDIAPGREPADTDVWLTEWQVAEDNLQVSINQQVDWALVPMDQEWLHTLFAGRRRVPLQLDTYADAVKDPSDPSLWTRLSGHVIRIDQISVRHQPSEKSTNTRGSRPEVEDVMEHSVQSLDQPRAHYGHIVGWIVRIRNKAD